MAGGLGFEYSAAGGWQAAAFYQFIGLLSILSLDFIDSIYSLVDLNLLVSQSKSCLLQSSYHEIYNICILEICFLI